MFLPAYSPDLNPIEEAFSKIKARLRRDNAEYEYATQQKDAGATVKSVLVRSVCSISELDAEGWFRNSGYLYD